MILAIGNSECLEYEAYKEVRDSLERRGEQLLLFRQNKCLQGEYLTFRVSKNIPIYSIVVEGKEYDVRQFTGIWYMHPMLPMDLLRHPQVEFRPFISAQFLEMRKALWSLMSKAKWLNDPWKMAQAENKIVQLSAATQSGLAVPDTIVTSDPEAVRHFYAEHGGRIIVKILATSPILDQVIYTNLVSEESIQTIETVKLSPSIFQEYIPKSYELRITVVGHQIFPVKILSQANIQTSIDWRAKPTDNDHGVMMEQCTLPEKIIDQIRHFMSAMGLNFGCIDMIVTPAGHYIFLEINPNGQWYFVQLKTGAQIAEAIAQLLV
ncbi:MAG: hypothetical protein WCT02_00235 [Candidatus Paceibacterota bacterium]